MFRGLKVTAWSIWKLLSLSKGCQKELADESVQKKRLFVLDLETGPGELLRDAAPLKADKTI